MSLSISFLQNCSLRNQIQWISDHTPSISTVAKVALAALALTAVATASIYFPITCVIIGTGSFLASRLFMERTESKFAEQFGAERPGEVHDEIRVHMIKSVRFLQDLADCRQIAQLVSLAAIVAFWQLTAPLIFVGAALGGVVLIVDYFDSRRCCRILNEMVGATIFNNAVQNGREIQEMRAAYPDDEEAQIHQKCRAEITFRHKRIHYFEIINRYTSKATGFILNNDLCQLEDVLGIEPVYIDLLSKFTVIEELESNDNFDEFRCVPLLRPVLEQFQRAKDAFHVLTPDQKETLKNRIGDPDNPIYQTAETREVYQLICACAMHRIRPQSVAVVEGIEQYRLRKFHLLSFLQSFAARWIGFIKNPALPCMME